MRIESLLRTTVKGAAVLLTAPATWQVAGQLYDAPLQKLLVQISALILLEGTMLTGWWELDHARGKATPGQLTLYAALAIIGFVGLNVVAVQHGEGMAGIVFRASLGVLLAYSVAESGLLSHIKLSQAADRDASSHGAVKTHRRKRAIAAEKVTIDVAHEIRLAELQAQKVVTLEALQRRTSRELTAVRAEHKAGLQAISHASNPSESDSKWPYPVELARQARSDKSRDIDDAILQAARRDPHASLRQLAETVGVKHETVRRHLHELEAQGLIRKNGHIEVLTS